ncbi:hypothetical protein JCM10450v2_003435, partial [Rhodotorula kratochvilovae]
MTSISSYSTRSRPPAAPHPLATHPLFVHARFERAVDIIQSLPKSGPIQTSYDQKLELYSVYKQATEGDIKGSRPGMLDILGRAKWDAWNKRRGMSQLEAERLYVDALMKILRSFSSRTQAVELLRELEDFDLDPPLRGEAGSVRPSQPDSSGSSDTGSSSTASYDARTRRAMAPPPPLHASAHSAARSSRSHRPPSVAPPLPGYGPPRTRADAVRAPPPREPPPQQHRQQYSDDEDSYSSSSSVAGARDVYHPAAASVPPSVRSRTALPSRIAPPSTSQAGPLRSVAGSVAGVPPLPLTAGNLRAATSRAPSVAPAPAPVPVRALTPAPAQPPPPLAPPQLDAALERIQLSLTALHERLSLLESSGTPASSPGGAGAGAPLALVSETVRRLLEA